MIDKLIKEIANDLSSKFFIEREDGSKLHTVHCNWPGDNYGYDLRNIRDYGDKDQKKLETYLIDKLKDRKDMFLIKDTFRGAKEIVTYYHIGNKLHPVYNVWFEMNKDSKEYKMLTNNTDL